jgi:TolB-like protein
VGEPRATAPYPAEIPKLFKFRVACFWLLLFFLFLAGSGFCFAQEQAITLHQGIARSMGYLTQRLPEKTRVVVLNFSAPTIELSDYVIEELSTYIVNGNNLVVVDRRNLELLQGEMNFQMSGEVSDDTAQAIGQKLGAQTIISGSFMSLGELYRMRVRAISVQTAEVQGQQTTTIKLDAILAALLHVKYRDPADFPLGNRIAAGFLNILAGAGSYSMGDWKGGLTLTGNYAVAAGLVLWDIFGFSRDDDFAGIPGAVGFGIAGITVLYGFIRPFIYQKPTNDPVLSGIDVLVVPGNRGIKTVGLLYTHRF